MVQNKSTLGGHGSANFGAAAVTFVFVDATLLHSWRAAHGIVMVLFGTGATVFDVTAETVIISWRATCGKAA